MIAVLVALLPRAAGAQLADGIFGPPQPFRIEAVNTRFTHFDQKGHGLQSRATDPNQPYTAPGSEELLVEQPQVEIVASQGDRVTHRLWVPVDVVTAASPDAIDAISTASRINVAGSLDVMTSYKVDARSEVAVRADVHIEENFRSWGLGFAATRSLAEDNTVIAVAINQVLDWFDLYSYQGEKIGRAYRSTSNGNLGLTQLLSPTTVAQLSYGVTVQSGELSNTWNTVPLVNGERAQERLPALRQRHAVAGHLAQYLPWRGTLKLHYRFYADDWGIQAHTAEVELFQRVARWAYLRAGYRLHHQDGVRFFTSLAPLDPASAPGAVAPDLPPRTADSDLQAFYAHTVGGAVVVDLALRRPRTLSLSAGYDRYWRSNDLVVNIYSGALGMRF